MWFDQNNLSEHLWEDTILEPQWVICLGGRTPFNTGCCCSYLDCPKANHIPRNRKLQSTKTGTKLNNTTGKVVHNDLVLQNRNDRRIPLCTHFLLWAWCWRSESWLQIHWLFFSNYILKEETDENWTQVEVGLFSKYAAGDNTVRNEKL